MTITQAIDDSSGFGQFIGFLLTFACIGIILNFVFQKLFGPKQVTGADGTPAFIDPPSSTQDNHAVVLIILAAIPVTLLCVLGAEAFGWLAICLCIIIPVVLVILRNVVSGLADPANDSGATGTNGSTSDSICTQIFGPGASSRVKTRAFLINSILTVAGLLPAVSFCKIGWVMGGFQLALFGFFFGGSLSLMALWYSTSRLLPSVVSNFYVNQAYTTPSTPATTPSTMGI